MAAAVPAGLLVAASQLPALPPARLLGWVSLDSERSFAMMAVAGALAGAAGALTVLWAGSATPGLFSPATGVGVLVAAVVGGIASPIGAVVGTVVVVGSRELLPGPWPFVFDVVAVVAMLRLAPGGLVELERSTAHRRRQARAPRVPTSAASAHLDCRGLVAGYGTRPVLHGVELAVGRGEIVGLLDLGDRRGERTAELSLGWRRRVALGIALASDPVLLLLDEPSAGLDGVQRARLPDVLRSVVERTGCAIVLAEHDTSLVERLGCRMMRLEAGRVDHARTGSP